MPGRKDDVARPAHRERVARSLAPGPGGSVRDWCDATTRAQDQGFHGRNNLDHARPLLATMDVTNAMTEDAPIVGYPTVVLVHGAFSDASSWNAVIERLQARGVRVAAPANPLRGISTDSDYIAGVFEQTPGPLLAVGHSYGGAVITNAATKAKNVVGLVYVAAFAPEEAEALADAEPDSNDSVLMSALVPLHYPTANRNEPDVEFAIDPARFRDAFAADLPAAQTAVMAATQRPAAEFAFSEPSGPPAWRRLPSWSIVATDDKAAGADIIRSMAQRAGAKITEVEGSHMIMISQPQLVTDVILEALAEVKAPANVG